MPCYLLTFESTHAAMAAQHALAGVGPAVIPMPREISAGCGMALRFEAEDAEQAASLGTSVTEARGLMALYLIEEPRAYTLITKL